MIQTPNIGGQSSLVSYDFYKQRDLRPPLSKKLFPVFRVGKETASREVGRSGFFTPPPPNFIF